MISWVGLDHNRRALGIAVVYEDIDPVGEEGVRRGLARLQQGERAERLGPIAALEAVKIFHDVVSHRIEVTDHLGVTLIFFLELG